MISKHLRSFPVGFRTHPRSVQPSRDLNSTSSYTRPMDPGPVTVSGGQYGHILFGSWLSPSSGPVFTRKLGKRRFCVISSASLSSMTNPRIAPPNRPDLNPTASATTIAEMCTTLLPDDLDAFSFRPPLGLGGATVFRDILRIDTSSRNLRSLGTRSAAVKLWNEISSSAAFGVNRYLSEVRLPLPVLGRFAVTGGNQVTKSGSP
mmetsp:Transcript_7172/g.16668  ORF Transcript_7172/g.16668 Transcript_7172/m.16668 type:complete len:205 (+) Transcript_7172:747-1361(+)